MEHEPDSRRAEPRGQGRHAGLSLSNDVRGGSNTSSISRAHAAIEKSSSRGSSGSASPEGPYPAPRIMAIRCGSGISRFNGCGSFVGFYGSTVQGFSNGSRGRSLTARTMRRTRLRLLLSRRCVIARASKAVTTETRASRSCRTRWRRGRHPELDGKPFTSYVYERSEKKPSPIRCGRPAVRSSLAGIRSSRGPRARRVIRITSGCGSTTVTSTGLEF